ncbi:RPS13 [Symbiodinium natans]|uniref:RPS13 protein n=1 Tax=Symbiodinium natans TaxID=878477 RepID=A0A812TWB3_9DINO|nr:RPS13 [Symbiodinium natans]
MRVTSKDIVQRIDRLQIFSRFADLNHLLVRSLVHRTTHAKPAEGVMLDDIGYGLREVKPRMALPAAELVDCMEEGLLQDAREVHQYVIGLCCVLVLLITCAGSAIFSLKQPSLAPASTLTSRYTLRCVRPADSTPGGSGACVFLLLVTSSLYGFGAG